MHHVLLLLQTEIVPGRSRPAVLAAAEPAPLIHDDRLDRREQLGGRHQADGHPRPLEHRLDDFAVRIIGNNHAVPDGVPPDDPCGRHPLVENRITCR